MRQVQNSYRVLAATPRLVPSRGRGTPPQAAADGGDLLRGLWGLSRPPPPPAREKRDGLCLPLLRLASLVLSATYGHYRLV